MFAQTSLIQQFYFQIWILKIYGTYTKQYICSNGKNLNIIYMSETGVWLNKFLHIQMKKYYVVLKNNETFFYTRLKASSPISIKWKRARCKKRLCYAIIWGRGRTSIFINASTSSGTIHMSPNSWYHWGVRVGEKFTLLLYVL